MTCSPARLAANRNNAQHSTGPKTTEGKAQSRRNGLKHGLTGAGIVLPDEDVEQVQQRFTALQTELDPKTTLGAALVQRIALFTIRLERSAKSEAATLSERVNNAEAAFDDARLAEVARLMNELDDNPAAGVQALKRMPEGVDRMIAAWEGLRSDLSRGEGRMWHKDRSHACDLMLGRPNDCQTLSPLAALNESLWMNSPFLTPAEGSDIEDNEARRAFARSRILEIIDAEIASLRAHRATLNLEPIAQDRAGARDRALFDTSKEAILARKYEAATERSLFRTLRELREVEAEAKAEAEAEAEAEVEPVPDPEPESESESLGSSLPRDPEPEAPTLPAASAPTIRPESDAVSPIALAPSPVEHPLR